MKICRYSQMFFVTNQISLLSSPSFTLLIGKDQKAITVQANLFKNVSDVLHTKMNSQMKEGLEKRSELDDVELEVFVGLCECVYTGDYYNTLPCAEESEGSEGSEEPEEVCHVSLSTIGFTLSLVRSALLISTDWNQERGFVDPENSEPG